MVSRHMYVSARSLRKILKFVTKRHIPVKIRFDDTNSYGDTDTYSESGIIKEYTVTPVSVYDYTEFHIHIVFDDDRVMEINKVTNHWEYLDSEKHNGPVMCGPSGCGPDNYFFIRKLTEEEISHG